MAFAATASKRGAFADMNKAAIDGAQALTRLSELTIFELRGEWRRLHRMPPPMRLSRDLLTRGVTYKLQERAYGGLTSAASCPQDGGVVEGERYRILRRAGPLCRPRYGKLRERIDGL